MSGRSAAFKNWILQQKFASDINLYVRLCTDASVASDTAIGTEAAFGGYVAGGVLFQGSAVNWSITTNVAENLVAVTFPECTSGDQVIRYFEIWSNNTGFAEADRLYWGQLDTYINVVLNKTVSFQAGDIVVTEN